MTVREFVQLLAVVPAEQRGATLRTALQEGVRGVTDDDLTVLVAVGVALTAIYLYTGDNGSGPDLSSFVGDVAAWAGTVQAPTPGTGPQNPPQQPTPSTQPPIQGGNGDQIDPRQIQIVNAPDFRDWPQTARISQIVMEPGNMRVMSDAPDRWPNQYPPGFADPIQFTVCLFLNVGGQWVGSGFIEGVGGYHGADGVGDSPFQFHADWYYGNRWTPMEQHGPIANGETIGICLVAGDIRDSKGPFTPDRTQIVAVQAVDTGTYSF